MIGKNEETVSTQDFKAIMARSIELPTEVEISLTNSSGGIKKTPPDSQTQSDSQKVDVIEDYLLKLLCKHTSFEIIHKNDETCGIKKCKDCSLETKLSPNF